MLRREARLGHAAFDDHAHELVTRWGTVHLPHWETPLLVLAAIALAIAGAMQGANWIASLFW